MQKEEGEVEWNLVQKTGGQQPNTSARHEGVGERIVQVLSEIKENWGIKDW